MEQQILFSIRNLPCPGAVTLAGRSVSNINGVTNVICSSGSCLSVSFDSQKVSSQALASCLSQDGWDAWQIPTAQSNH